MQINNISLYNSGVIIVYTLVILLTDAMLASTLIALCVVKCVVDAMVMISVILLHYAVTL